MRGPVTPEDCSRRSLDSQERSEDRSRGYSRGRDRPGRGLPRGSVRRREDRGPDAPGQRPAHLDQIEDKVRLYDDLFLEKEEVKAEYDELFTYTARTFEGYCRLAGLSPR